MDIQQLSSLIKVDGDTFSLAKGQLGSSVDKVVSTISAGNTIQVIGAPKVTSDQETERVIVSGGCMSFMNRADVPVRFIFLLDEKDEVQAIVEFMLRGSMPTPRDWKFSNSFPELPKVFSYENLIGDSGSDDGLSPPPLDELDLFDSYFVVTSFETKTYSIPTKDNGGAASGNGVSPKGTIALTEGLNFVSHMRKSGVLGVLAAALGADEVLTLYGPIKLYFSTTTETPLNTLLEEMPWEAADKRGKPVVGIDLQADLGIPPINLTDDLSFTAKSFRIYSPPSNDFLKAYPTFSSKVAFTGELKTKDGNIDVDITAIAPPQANELAIVGVFNVRTVDGVPTVDGLSIGNIANLVQLAGPSDLVSNMPDQLQSVLDAVRLKRTAVYVSGTFPKLSLDAVSATIGLPDDKKWTVWQGSGSGPPAIAAGGLSALFEIRAPFSSPSLNVTVSGIVSIEGVDFRISASSSNDFAVQTELTKKQPIPLNSLMKTYAPGVPAPSDLTINALRMTAGLRAPNRCLEMNALFASDPSWDIPIGPTTLQVSNVNLNFRYDRAASKLSGSFGGQLKFGDVATVSMRYVLPADLTIRAAFPELNLTQLIKKLSDPVASLNLPPDFDFKLINSFVMLKKAGNDYTFTLGTEVSEFGLLAFTAYRKEGTWAFAAGLSIQENGLAKVPAIGDVLDQFAKFVGFRKLMLVVSSTDDPGFTFPAMAEFNTPNLTGNLTLPATANGLTKGLNLYAAFSFSQCENKGLSTLLRYLELDRLDLGLTVAVSIPDPLENSKLFISAGGATAGNEGTEHKGKLNDVTTFSVKLGVGVQNRTNYFVFLVGSVQTQIGGTQVSFDVQVQVQTNGILIMGSIVTKEALKIGPVQVANLALVIGVSYELLPSFGFAATLAIGKTQASLAVFANANNPAQSMFAGAVTDITLKDVVDTFTANAISGIDDVLGEVGIAGTHHFKIPVNDPGVSDSDNILLALENHNIAKVAAAFAKYGQEPWNLIPTTSSGVLMVTNLEGRQWSLTTKETKIRHFELKRNGPNIDVWFNAQVYVAPQTTYLGEIRYPQGIFLTGRLNIFDFIEAEMTILIDSSKGIAVQAAMKEIVIGAKELFSITSDDNILKQLSTANSGQAGEAWAKQVQLSWEANEKLGLGGPLIDIATFAQPDNPVPEFQGEHFYINGKLTILGASFGLYANFSKSSKTGDYAFMFAIDSDFLIMKFNVNGYFKALNDMALNGSIFVGLYEVGGFRITSGFEAKISIAVTPRQISANVSASLMFAGEKMTIATFGLDIQTEALKNLPGTLGDKLLDLLKDPIQCAMKTATALL